MYLLVNPANVVFVYKINILKELYVLGFSPIIRFSIISTGEFNSDWSRSSHYDAIFTALGGEYSISRLGY